jgi:hypothetical protein
LFGAAEQHIHALWTFYESKRARSHHNIVAREAGNNDIGFTPLEAVACEDKLSVASGLAKPNNVLFFAICRLSKCLNQLTWAK